MDRDSQSVSQSVTQLDSQTDRTPHPDNWQIVEILSRPFANWVRFGFASCCGLFPLSVVPLLLEKFSHPSFD